jgi:hypothetical protein
MLSKITFFLCLASTFLNVKAQSPIMIFRHADIDLSLGHANLIAKGEARATCFGNSVSGWMSNNKYKKVEIRYSTYLWTVERSNRVTRTADLIYNVLKANTTLSVTKKECTYYDDGCYFQSNDANTLYVLVLFFREISYMMFDKMNESDECSLVRSKYSQRIFTTSSEYTKKLDCKTRCDSCSPSNGKWTCKVQ